MRLKLRRFDFQPHCTIGKLSMDDASLGIYTLEDKIGNVKVYGETAIPVGTYKVVVTFSPHFGRELPLLLNVPNFEGIRIHPGNTSEDTEGCILVGEVWEGGNFIGRSREAFYELFDLIKKSSDVTLEIG